MERKNYLVEELSKEEKAYFEKAIISARNNYIKKNYNYINSNIEELSENIVDEQCSVLELVIKKCEAEICSAIKFELEFSDPKLYRYIKALSYDEKMMLFSLYKKNKSIRLVAKEQKIDKDTVRRRRDHLLNEIKNILGDENNV